MNDDLSLSAIEISKEAGEVITDIYNSDFDYDFKKDLSPITKADHFSNQLITEKLGLLKPKIPIITEENSEIPFSIRSQWKRYWLVDPLDGTKEFINRNGEFTVNIALIENNIPIFGVIHIPLMKKTYWGSRVKGSFCLDENNIVKQISVSKQYQNPIRLVSSRSHPSEMLNDLTKQLDECEIIKVGSSIKFCLIASGKAECYPRLGPTSEWDTAAGDAIVKFAGGHITSVLGQSLQYNLKKDYLNPNFIASNNRNLSKKILNLINKS